MNYLINASIVALALAVSLVCLAGLMSVEQATAQNVESIYLSLHGGAK